MNQAVKTESVKKSSTLGQKGFFVISSEKWDTLRRVRASVNEMASYLVLACGTGADHKTTSWSAGAIYKYAGISPRTATKAIMGLHRYNIVETKKAAKKSSFPVYKLCFDYNPKTNKENDNIYIPSGVVVGVSGEKSPLERLVNEQDELLLYLFIRLYAFQNKELDVISPGIISTLLNGKDIEPPEISFNESNLLNLWAYPDIAIESIWARSATNFFDFNKNIFTKKSFDPENEDGEETGIFAFFERLNEIGLIKKCFIVSRGDKSTLDTFDPVFEITKSKQSSLVDMLCIIADEQGKLRENGEVAFQDIKDCIAGKFFVAPASYKKLHIHGFYQMRYRTDKGASKVKYAMQKKYENEVNILINKIRSK